MKITIDCYLYESQLNRFFLNDNIEFHPSNHRKQKAASKIEAAFYI